MKTLSVTVRKTVQGLEGQEDGAVLRDWLRQVFADTLPAKASPRQHFLVLSVLKAIGSAKNGDFELTDEEFFFVRETLLEARYSVAIADFWTSVLENFGIFFDRYEP